MVEVAMAPYGILLSRLFSTFLNEPISQADFQTGQRLIFLITFRVTSRYTFHGS